MSAAQPASALSRWFPALAEGPVRLYLTGQVVSVLGSWVLDITLNLLVWQLSASPGWLGVLNFLIYGPALVVTPLFSSRLTAANARRSTLLMLAGAMAVAVSLMVLMGAGLLTMPIIIGFAAVRGVLNGMEMPARHMLLLASIVDRTRIGNAVGMNTMVFQIARMVGPAIAAALFGTVGAVWGFATTVLALAFMYYCVIRQPKITAAPQGGLESAEGQGVMAAIAYVRRNRFGALFLPLSVCVGLFAGAYQTLVPVLADHVYGNAEKWTALFFAAAGAGALVAAVLLSSRYMLGVMRRLHVATPWLVVAALAGIGLTRTAAVALPCFAMVGFGIAFISSGTNAVLQQHVPAELRGGLIGLFLASFAGTLPIAQLLGGTIAQRLSVQTTFLAMAGGLLVCVAAFMVPRWRAVRRLELDAQKL